MPSRRPRSDAQFVVRAELQDFALHHQHDLVLAASITAAAMVAQVDGTVDPAERTQLIAWMQRARLLDDCTASDAAAAFDRRLEQLHQPGGLAAALHTLRRAAGLPHARLVVAGATAVAQADGRVEPCEARTLSVVRQALFPVHAGRLPTPAGT